MYLIGAALCTDGKWEMIQFLAQKENEEEELAVLIYRGKTSLSRNPQRGENALWKLCEDLCDYPFAQHGFCELLQYFKAYLLDDFLWCKKWLIS